MVIDEYEAVQGQGSFLGYRAHHMLTLFDPSGFPATSDLCIAVIESLTLSQRWNVSSHVRDLGCHP